MKVIPIREFKDASTITYDTVSRKDHILHLSSVYITGRNSYYPNTLILARNSLLSPYDEKVMSLNKDSFYDNNEYDLDEILIKHMDNNNYFFFIYNVDNYYHFLYDTLPYLFYYKELLKTYPDLILLINTSNRNMGDLPLFVKEILQLLNITNIAFPKPYILYSSMFFGTSLTHGGKSNYPPSDLCHSIWNSIVPNIEIETPKKIYISRRSHLSKHPENIGTNYTQRRKCVNEDALVELLKTQGFVEVLCEDLSMEEKMLYFRNATHVAGFIGGGMANCLFSKPSTKVLCFESPTFLDVNSRFAYSMNHTDVSYIKCTSHVKSEGKYTLYTRVKYNDNIGEIEDYSNGLYKIKMSNNDVAGFSQNFNMDIVEAHEDELVPLDNGLNSPFECDLEIIKLYL